MSLGTADTHLLCRWFTHGTPLSVGTILNPRIIAGFTTCCWSPLMRANIPHSGHRSFPLSTGTPPRPRTIPTRPWNSSARKNIRNSSGTCCCADTTRFSSGAPAGSWQQKSSWFMKYTAKVCSTAASSTVECPSSLTCPQSPARSCPACAWATVCWRGEPISGRGRATKLWPWLVGAKSPSPPNAGYKS